MSRILYRCVLCMTLSWQAFAGDVEDAVQSMRAGNFAEAYCILKPYAEKGDPEAQYNIGWMYLNGYGLAMNDSLALEWWQRASAQGYTDATFSIAMLYSLGEGQVEKNMEKAVDHYLKAARNGHEDAIIILRSMLARNDPAIRKKSADIIESHGRILGPLYDVSVDRANVREGPGLDANVVRVLEEGHTVVELAERKQWMQVGVLDSGEIVWIYKSLLRPHTLPSSADS